MTKILLLRNYAPDRQQSMQRFAELLQSQLADLGHAVETIQPKPVFGRFSASTMGSAQKWLGYVDKYLLFPRQIRRAVSATRAEDQPSLVHICDHANSVYLRQTPEVPALVTCHDLLAARAARGEFRESRSSALGKLLQARILLGLSEASHVCCDSTATKKDLNRLTRATESSVIHIGLNYPYAPLPLDRAIPILRRSLPVLLQRSSAGQPIAPFLLHVGGNQWYKNRLGVIEIYNVLRQFSSGTPDLVLAGKPLPEALQARIRLSGLASRVHVVPDCSNELLHALYSCAALLLFPSLAEGFGWPVPEAQACGCLVVASNIEPLTEVGGPAAIYADPRQIASFAVTLANVLGLPRAEREQRRAACLENAARFSPQAMTRAYLGLYSKLTARNQSLPVLRLGGDVPTQISYAHSTHHPIR